MAKRREWDLAGLDQAQDFTTKILGGGGGDGRRNTKAWLWIASSVSRPVEQLVTGVGRTALM